jgi:hypothetical protein
MKQIAATRRAGWIPAAMAAVCLAVAGCQAAQARRPAEAPPAPTPSLAEVQNRWEWVNPGAIVLEVKAVRGWMVSMAGGRAAGLAPDFLMRVYRGDEYLATVKTIEVGPEFTVAEVTNGSATLIRPGDVGVYLP